MMASAGIVRRAQSQGVPVEKLSIRSESGAHLARLGGAVVSVLALASCGGGGGGGGSDTGSGLVASSSVAQHCAVPRSTDVQGTVADEKAWVRS